MVEYKKDFFKKYRIVNREEALRHPEGEMKLSRRMVIIYGE